MIKDKAKVWQFLEEIKKKKGARRKRDQKSIFDMALK
jgi:hypothetical protein